MNNKCSVIYRYFAYLYTKGIEHHKNASGEDKQIGEETALAHIIRMVQEAQNSKAPVQRVIDKVALVFVPVVAIISLLTFLSWWILGGNAAFPPSRSERYRRVGHRLSVRHGAGHAYRFNGRYR